MVDVTGVPGLQFGSQMTPKMQEEYKERQAKDTVAPTREGGDTQEEKEDHEGEDEGEEKDETRTLTDQKDVSETQVLPVETPEAEVTLDASPGKPATEKEFEVEAQREEVEPGVQEGEREPVDSEKTGPGQVEEVSQVQEASTAGAATVEPVALDSEQSSQELVRILMEAFTGLAVKQSQNLRFFFVS